MKTTMTMMMVAGALTCLLGCQTEQAGTKTLTMTDDGTEIRLATAPDNGDGGRRQAAIHDGEGRYILGAGDELGGEMHRIYLASLEQDDERYASEPTDRR